MPGPISQPTHTNIHVDERDQIRRLWQAVRHAGGFDSNADPVIIGAGATAAGGLGDISIGASTTANGSHAIAVGLDAGADGVSGVAVGDHAFVYGDHGVAIGLHAKAETTATDGVAIGNTAFAGNADAVAIGAHSTAVADDSIAIGTFAFIEGARTVAIGYYSGGDLCDDGTAIGPNAALDNAASNGTAVGSNAGARRDSATALGYNADALHVGATALGTGAHTTADHQVMIGSNAGFVEIPGDSSTVPNGLVFTDTDGSFNRWILQVTAGAVVLNAAP